MTIFDDQWTGLLSLALQPKTLAISSKLQGGLGNMKPQLIMHRMTQTDWHYLALTDNPFWHQINILFEARFPIATCALRGR